VVLENIISMFEMERTEIIERAGKQAGDLQDTCGNADVDNRP